jgi:hypothetical protein
MSWPRRHFDDLPVRMPRNAFSLYIAPADALEPAIQPETVAWPLAGARLPSTDGERAARLDQYGRATENVLEMVRWHGPGLLRDVCQRLAAEKSGRQSLNMDAVSVTLAELYGEH